MLGEGGVTQKHASFFFFLKAEGKSRTRKQGPTLSTSFLSIDRISLTTVDCRWWQQQNPYINLTPSVSSHEHILPVYCPWKPKSPFICLVWGGPPFPHKHYSLLKSCTSHYSVTLHWAFLPGCVSYALVNLFFFSLQQLPLVGESMAVKY